MNLSITRKYRFSASHRLYVPAFSEEKNARLYGKCNNPFGHGHDYVLSVTAAGPGDERTGLLVKRAELDGLVSQAVLPLFRHKYLNLDVQQFAALVPTTENVAAVIASLLQENWRTYIGNPDARLSRIHVQETDRNSFEILIPLRPEQNKERIHESVIVHA
jgi:6-pyruvoyltetrahydropterin/6-carboxytetrahydropterin synthase